MDPRASDADQARTEASSDEVSSKARRSFLKTAAIAGAGAVVATAFPATATDAAPPATASAPEEDSPRVNPPTPAKGARPGVAMIDTVLGELKPDGVGKVLAHEHLYVDFSLFNALDDPNYMQPVGGFDAAVDVIAEYVLDVKAQGVELIVDWGCMGVGRSVDTARKIALRTGVDVAIPTGIYKWLLEPRFAGWSVDELTDYMVNEFKRGIDGSGIKPAFIKMGADPVPTAVETRIHRAAVQAAAEVGATVACHLPFPLDARSETEIGRARQLWALAQSAGVKPDRFVWGHANGVVKADKVSAAHLNSALAQYFELAAEGSTLQFDAVGSDPSNAADPWFGGPTDPEVFLSILETFVAKGYGDQVMISNDASVYVNPGGGQGGELAADYAAAGLPNWQYPRDIRYVFGTFAPLMVDRLGSEAATQILSGTPARVFSRVRKPSID